MNQFEEEVLKKWRPGTKEVDSWFVVYFLNDERYGMYVMAVNNMDAQQQVLESIPNAKIQKVEQQSPTKEHEEALRNRK